jgi:ethanolamine utilization protein EutA (predicted chaperonin)
MKKILLLLTMLVGAMTAQAEDYTYLTFETTDGAKASVSVASDVTLTISGTTLTVGSQSFTLTNLSKMYFSNTDETTGIEEITSATLDEATDIYDLQGHKVTKDQMRRGVYIVKTNSRTYKMVVR